MRGWYYKMKKLIALFSVILTLMLMYPTTIFADEKIITDSYVEYFDDGSYVVTEFEESGISTFATSTTTKAKTSTYYTSNNVKQWMVVVTGTFNYTGSSATCTKSTTSYTIYDNSWKVTSSAASKSGNKATGTFTIKNYVLGIPVKTVNKTLTITCSNTGVCS